MKKIVIFTLFFIICKTVFANPSTVSRLNELQFGAERPKIGVVLSGGGAKGIAHVGTLKMLEELNIPVDYIGGTSMGAIVGSLYAMGYTADQIDTIIRVTDWMSLFNDAPRREHIGVHEKKNSDPYQLRLALALNEFAIFARGAIEGQHIDNMLTHYLFEAYKTSNFSDLKIPFFAIGADIITAEYVVLDSGHLAKAVRASMAVPTVFSPVEIDGRLLVDGGVVNNFPVLEMRRRGADIIIGVDVGYQYRDINELQNIANILEQIVFLSGQGIHQGNIDDTDILIVPDLAGLGALSFSRYNTILERGRQAAEDARPELSKLATILSEKYGRENVPTEPYSPRRTVVLDTIILHGNDAYSDRFILSKLRLQTRKSIQVEDVENAVNRLFGTLRFTKVNYRFEKSSLGAEYTTLHVNIHEAPFSTVKLGFRYDNIRGPSLLAGGTARSPKFQHSEFNINLDLSLFPTVDVEYRFLPTFGRSKRNHSTWAPLLFVSYSFSNFSIYDYNVVLPDSLGNPIKIFRDQEHNVYGHRAAVGTEISVRNNVLGFGLYLDQTASNVRIGEGEQRLSAYYLYPQLYYIRNSFNRQYYPTKGSIVNARFRFVNNLSNDATTDWVNTFATGYVDAQYAIPISKRLIVYPSAMFAGTIVFSEEDQSQNYISEQQQFYHGGLFSISHLNQTPFVGLYFMQKVGLYGANVQINAQYEVFRNLFLSARIGALKSENGYSEMFELHNAVVGWGFSASFNTTVGPIGITVQRSTVSPASVFINLGFWL
jgi:NTE family protein